MSSTDLSYDHARVYRTRHFIVVVRWDVNAGKHYVNLWMGDTQLAFAQAGVGFRRGGVRLAANIARRILMWPQRRPL